MSFKIFFAASLLAAADLVAGHAAIIKAVGDAGGEGMALGVDTATPRDGTRRNPFQQDATRFKGAQAATFGETVGAGQNNLEAGTKAIMAETGAQLPQVKAGGSVTMTLHQVNGDGGGPYTCSVNADATGAQWTDIKVTTTPPGQNSRNRQGAATDFPLVAQLPASQACTGTVAGQENVCLVRCQNAARAGPFGGVVPVQMAGAQTPAQARRALAISMKRSEEALDRLMKRAAKIDLSKLSAEEIQELREDGEIA
ncbi:MAS3 protein [Gaeumannomyces tritici R3-111a-1]|uniref:MAS3 protein n=1 Tax=Gaeumannomyces tritici (strain R3-111a-1) TaxID=644352 RepID=J3P5N5_GAET3|nr:MAS3 protein [Gaeumannomyces tritici R3-111a-1]EJT74987.1 MAS3 protein [Gaeumannomyces tritici R3-111a-1]